MKQRSKALFLLAFILCSGLLLAQDVPGADPADPAEVAKKLSNPVASLISVPFQNNLDVGIGGDNASRNTMNFQPVIPVRLTPKLNLINRLVLPIVAQYNVTGPGTFQYGLSDALVSAFISPVEPWRGFIFGAGPALLVPTATDDVLASKKFGIGPTALVLRQENGWTYGALLSQVWSVAGDIDRPDVSQFYAQPFVAYNWNSGAGVVVNAEVTQYWLTKATSAFVNPLVTGVTKLGGQVASLGVGPRIQVASTDGTRADLGVRALLTLVFPK